TSEEQCAEVVELGQPVRVGGKQQLAERNKLQRFADQRSAERAGVVHGQADIDEDVAEYLRQVRGVAVERVVVHQQHWYSALLGCPEEWGQSQRICAQQVEVGVAVPDVELQR